MILAGNKHALSAMLAGVAPRTPRPPRPTWHSRFRRSIDAAVSRWWSWFVGVALVYFGGHAVLAYLAYLDGRWPT